MDGSAGPRLNRRGFVAGTIAAALAACADGEVGDVDTTTTATSPPTTATPTTAAPTTAAATTTSVPTVTSDPFTLGVASGDPLSDSVILWTRVYPAEPLAAELGDIEIEWEMATDADMTEVVASGVGTAVAALGHSVHVDATGLSPDTEYHYRFMLDGFETTPARTRTFAAAGTTPERFRFAFSSCQNWEQGYYAAYRELVEQGGIDAFLFLGDYIYEYASGGYADDRGRKTDQDFECESVEQYRERYTLYRTDPLLQAAHALVPWIITWDDHEVDNDYAAASSEEDAEREAFLARRAAGYQVWYENMPVRLDPPQGSDYGSSARSHMATSCSSTSSTRANTAPTSNAANHPWRSGDQLCKFATRNLRRRPNKRCSALRSATGCSTAWRRQPRPGTCSRNRCSCSAAMPLSARSL